MQIFHAHGRAHTPSGARANWHRTSAANGALTHRPPRLSAVGQPPLAPLGAEAAPGRLAPASAPLLGVPDGAVEGAVEGAADMPLAALESELAAPLSPFFWQPAPAARPAIRMPAKTARDT
ncbi:hypothetical protein [Burkholderia cenocepacia]|uniref:hypothetical protein n=1 Tax=Burkholderia cenocepacia TaxID=95486 RepID=UPI002854CCFF|nr:hypothetical protein [Burkholderia cenocepacia]MDR5666390.1 hypothetical protein [Burkholderia cenocepacia]MDR5669403.1 hypothetical protein [Burkholderia cenocepacia]MDR8099016.1 hypothetical protein [Burkholderia cenocepacia]